MAHLEGRLRRHDSGRPLKRVLGQRGAILAALSLLPDLTERLITLLAERVRGGAAVAADVALGRELEFRFRDLLTKATLRSQLG